MFKKNKQLDRLNKMIDNAIEGKPIENGFDESKMSAIETRLSKYLAMNNATKKQLNYEKEKINALVSDISHQTKTPITNTLMYSQLLKEAMGANDKNEMYVDAIIEQSEKLNFLLSSLVKISRIETGIITLTPKLKSVNELLEVAIRLMKSLAESKNISLVLEKSKVQAFFDEIWTLEAVVNIIDNAIKYTENNGKVFISVTQYPLFSKIDIKDTGIGIGLEEQAQIFTRFYRSKNVSEYEGTGLGLYLSREIVNNQGGYIKVSSEENKGATFSVFLPNEKK
ncbi:MAG: sensor histidine kinase [Lachnospirales bacterium]